MRKETLLKLNELLTCNLAEEDLQEFCRSSVENEFEWMSDAIDKKMLVDKVVRLMNFPVVVPDSMPVCSRREVDKKLYVILLLCAVIYLVLNLICKLTFLGWIISTIAMFVLIYFFQSSSGNKVSGKVQVLYKSADEIAMEIDKVVNYLNGMMRQDKDESDFPMERNPYLPLLRQIYNKAIETDDEIERKKLIWTLENAGYAMIEYSDECSDMFEKYESKITQVTTTAKALINQKTKLCIFKGIVVFPIK